MIRMIPIDLPPAEVAEQPIIPNDFASLSLFAKQRNRLTGTAVCTVCLPEIPLNQVEGFFDRVAQTPLVFWFPEYASNEGVTYPDAYITYTPGVLTATGIEATVSYSDPDHEYVYIGKKDVLNPFPA